VALVGIPAVLVLLYLGGWPLAVPVAVLAALGALEVFRMASQGGVASLQTLGASGAAALVLAAAWHPTFEAFAPLALGILAALVGVSLIGAIVARGPERKPLAVVGVTLFAVLYAGLPMSFVPLLHALPETHGWAGGSRWAGALAVALPLASTWLGDAVAFFAGTAWGHGGLAPTISPNKSWVGVWGGLCGAGLAAAAWFLIAGWSLPALPVPGVVVAALVGVVLGLGAIVGDLAESLLKRDAGVKDSGTLFPGHGGVLDRLDALIFTLPTAYVALVAMEVAS
jgi:phosphatidate cytidylyltransferase